MDFGVERKETGFKLRLRLSQIDVTMRCKFRTDIGIIGQASKTLVGDGWSNAVEPPEGTWMRAYVRLQSEKIRPTNAGSQLEEQRKMIQSSISNSESAHNDALNARNPRTPSAYKSYLHF